LMEFEGIMVKSNMRAATLGVVLMAQTMLAANAQQSPRTVGYACPFCDLRGIDMSNQDLSDSNLQGANLSGANLSGAILNGVMLARANLSNADLSNARLGRSAKGRADLSAANLAGARLQGAIFDGTDLEYADLSQANLTGVDLSRVIGRNMPSPAADADVTCGAADLSRLTQRVYVSMGGTDSDHCGAAPSSACATIGRALALCGGPQLQTCGVLVMTGRYKLGNFVELDSPSPQTGSQLYGGCTANGTPGSEDLQSLIEAPFGKPAIVAEGGLIQGFKIVGSDSPPGQESVALRVLESDVTVKNTRILGGQVVAGAGAAPPNSAKGDDGVAARGAVAGRSNACPRAAGGNGSVIYQVSAKWKFANTGVNCDNHCSDWNCWGYGAWAGAAGGAPGRGRCTTNQCPGFGDQGDQGSPGAAGANGACGGGGQANRDAFGQFADGVWRAAFGSPGALGADGGGGGGGGAGGYKGGSCGPWNRYEGDGNQGGGGGGGGCRGAAGFAGNGGGASFAVEAYQPFSLVNSAIVGGIGGDGSNGADGASGGGIGSGAAGLDEHNGADGGSGGNGGGGGASGGGAGGNGGSAVGVVFAPPWGYRRGGSLITDAGTIYYLGASGAPGKGGQGGTASVTGACTGAKGADGVAGVVADKYPNVSR
jgi:uncharacterized protein YjbI with pentapeptide repeats